MIRTSFPSRRSRTLCAPSIGGSPGLGLLAVAFLAAGQLVGRRGISSARWRPSGPVRTVCPRRSEAPSAPRRGRGNPDARSIHEQHGRAAGPADSDDRPPGERARAVLSSMEEGVLAVDQGGTILASMRPVRHCWASKRQGARPGRPRSDPQAGPARVHRAALRARAGRKDIELSRAENRWLHAHGTVLHDAEQRRRSAP